MGEPARLEVVGRRSWGMNRANKGLLNTSLDSPGLGWVAVHKKGFSHEKGCRQKISAFLSNLKEAMDTLKA